LAVEATFTIAASLGAASSSRLPAEGEQKRSTVQATMGPQ
jgi:hypothetical protein